MSFVAKAIGLAERGLVPDSLVRWGIRRLLKARLAELKSNTPAAQRHAFNTVVEKLRQSAIAEQTDKANEQHYEVPTEFFLLALGKHRKYSCCYFPTGTESLDEAEAQMLRLTCKRAGLRDGMEILELGCGWGALTLWMAEHYPNARILAVSNSRTQRQFIYGECRKRGLENVEVMTCDVNKLDLDGRQFDRVVSLEMFEHVRNYEQLLERISGWIKSDGRMFVHIFCHGNMPYTFEARDSSDWMSEYFFSGGVMPSDDLFYHFQKDVTIDKHWRVNGRHYALTARGWLDNMDRHKSEIMPILAKTYGKADAAKWFYRWRIFFMSCEELWAWDRGREWWVSHYLFAPRPSGARRSDQATRSTSGAA